MNSSVLTPVLGVPEQDRHPEQGEEGIASIWEKGPGQEGQSPTRIRRVSICVQGKVMRMGVWLHLRGLIKYIKHNGSQVSH